MFCKSLLVIFSLFSLLCIVLSLHPLRASNYPFASFKPFLVFILLENHPDMDIVLHIEIILGIFSGIRTTVA